MASLGRVVETPVVVAVVVLGCWLFDERVADSHKLIKKGNSVGIASMASLGRVVVVGIEPY